MEWLLQNNDSETMRVCVDALVRTVAVLSDTATVLTLSGDIGVGKTTLVQALARTLGVNDVVTSPTFTIMKSYSCSQMFDQLIHLDVYRFTTAAEAHPLHLTDVWKRPRTLVCIEWPERIHELLPTSYYSLVITTDNAGTRRVTLTVPST